MRKEYISKILGDSPNVVEIDNGSAIFVTIKTDDIDVYVTVPYDVNEVFWEAKNKDGTVLVKDSHDFYVDTEHEDIKGCLLDIHDVMKVPKFRICNGGKTIEAYGYHWYYLFGEFCS
ncbi:hypothetical protein J8M20_03015 [Pseudoalteromonas luteoviolacea]|uniref:hypothetical protein n=1 Tax=Pseudoalteromonas luteoviolacea TaxID=43657 RepID=UPI001B389AC8|nr:hypothetical protein [Pseudoalteromonas luteoviolacea]MBQ4810286.1 hypothetical protein [Pseudoalteromonas luteoviolacea]